VAAGDITTQPKQGRQAVPMSSLCILLCLWHLLIKAYSNLIAGKITTQPKQSRQAAPMSRLWIILCQYVCSVYSMRCLWLNQQSSYTIHFKATDRFNKFVTLTLKLLIYKLCKFLLCLSSIVVKHSTYNPEVEGLNPATLKYAKVFVNFFEALNRMVWDLGPML